MKLEPLADRVLVKRVVEGEKMVGLIIIPETAKEKSQLGTVIAAGPGRMTDEGKSIPLTVKAGDQILVGKYAGTEVEIENEKYLIMREEDVLGVVRET